MKKKIPDSALRVKKPPVTPDMESESEVFDGLVYDNRPLTPLEREIAEASKERARPARLELARCVDAHYRQLFAGEADHRDIALFPRGVIHQAWKAGHTTHWSTWDGNPRGATVEHLAAYLLCQRICRSAMEARTLAVPLAQLLCRHCGWESREGRFGLAEPSRVCTDKRRRWSEGARDGMRLQGWRILRDHPSICTLTELAEQMRIPREYLNTWSELQDLVLEIQKRKNK